MPKQEVKNKHNYMWIEGALYYVCNNSINLKLFYDKHVKNKCQNIFIDAIVKAIYIYIYLYIDYNYKDTT